MNLVVGRRYSFDYIVREYCRANKAAMSDLRFEFFYKDICYPEFDAKPYGSIIDGKQYFSKIASRYDRRGFLGYWPSKSYKFGTAYHRTRWYNLCWLLCKTS